MSTTTTTAATPTPPAAFTPPVVAWRMRNAIGTCSLHHERVRAEDAAVTHRGTVMPLIECPDSLRAVLVHAMDIACRAVLEDIEAHADLVLIDGVRWFDITPMRSEHEHSPEVLDMTHQALAFATLVGLIRQHPTRAHLVCAQTLGL